MTAPPATPLNPVPPLPTPPPPGGFPAARRLWSCCWGSTSSTTSIATSWRRPSRRSRRAFSPPTRPTPRRGWAPWRPRSSSPTCSAPRSSAGWPTGCRAGCWWGPACCCGRWPRGPAAWPATFAILLLLRMFVGVGEAGYGPAAPTLIADLYPVVPPRRGAGVVLRRHSRRQRHGLRPRRAGGQALRLAAGVLRRRPAGNPAGADLLFHEGARPGDGRRLRAAGPARRLPTRHAAPAARRPARPASAITWSCSRPRPTSWTAWAWRP